MHKVFYFSFWGFWGFLGLKKPQKKDIWSNFFLNYFYFDQDRCSCGTAFLFFLFFLTLFILYLSIFHFISLFTVLTILDYFFFFLIISIWSFGSGLFLFPALSSFSLLLDCIFLICHLSNVFSSFFSSYCFLTFPPWWKLSAFFYGDPFVSSLMSLNRVHSV